MEEIRVGWEEKEKGQPAGEKPTDGDGAIGEEAGFGSILEEAGAALGVGD